MGKVYPSEISPASTNPEIVEPAELADPVSPAEPNEPVAPAGEDA